MNFLANAKHYLPVGTMNNSKSMFIKSSLQFLHDIWWRLQISGIEHLPEEGPVFIVSNCDTEIPWPGLMLTYGMTMNGNHHTERPVNLLWDDNYANQGPIYDWLQPLSIASWSYEAAKQILERG